MFCFILFSKYSFLIASFSYFIDVASSLITLGILLICFLFIWLWFSLSYIIVSLIGYCWLVWYLSTLQAFPKYLVILKAFSWRQGRAPLLPASEADISAPLAHTQAPALPGLTRHCPALGLPALLHPSQQTGWEQASSSRHEEARAHTALGR